MYQTFFIKQLKLELKAVQPMFVQQITETLKYVYELCNYNEYENI